MWQNYPTLAAARQWSLARIQEIQQALAGIESPKLQCAVLTGSLARLDAGEQSDGDLIVVVTDACSSKQASIVIDEVWQRLAPLGLQPPKPGGVYTSPTSRAELCDGPRGVVEEDVKVFGKRIQLLLESRCVRDDEACRQLQRAILHRYASHPFAPRSGQRWSYLTDDLIRYWRSYRVWRQWDTTQSRGGWYLRNLKLRYSRLLTYAGLLLLCTRDLDIESMLDLLPMTPLERIHWADTTQSEFATICQHYEAFLRIMQDVDERAELESPEITSVEDALRKASPAFLELIDQADELVAALWRLLGETASERVLSKLVF